MCAFGISAILTNECKSLAKKIFSLMLILVLKMIF